MGRVIVILGILLSATQADANVSMHSNPKTSIVRGGKAWKLKIRLQDYDGTGNVQIGIIRREHANKELTRTQARNPDEGILLHQFPKITEGLGSSTSVEVELTAPFNAQLRPGAKLSVVSAWGTSHVFGGVTADADEGSFIVLPRPRPPKPKTNAAPTEKTDAAPRAPRTRKPAATKTAMTAAPASEQSETN